MRVTLPKWEIATTLYWWGGKHETARVPAEGGGDGVEELTKGGRRRRPSGLAALITEGSAQDEERGQWIPRILIFLNYSN